MALIVTDEIWNRSNVKVDAGTNYKPETKDLKKVSNWDATYQPIIENLGLQKKINYGSAKHIMRAVNGRYDGVMSQLKTEDPALYNKFKDFKNNSWAFAKELEVMQEGGNSAKIDEYYNKASAMFSQIANSLDYSKNKRFAIDEHARVLTREQFDKYSQEVQVGNKASTNARVVLNQGELKADYETWNTSGEYAKLKNVSDYWMNSIKKKAQPIVSSWVATSLKNIDTDDVSKSDFNREAWDINVDVLKHISKYGTVENSNLVKQDKDKALRIQKEMWGKDYKSQLKVLQKYSDTIQGMSSRLGFYGGTKILNSHKDTIGKKLEYYPQTSEKSRNDFADKDMTAIGKMMEHYKEFKEVDKNFRTKAVALSKNNFEEIRDGLGLDLERSQFNVAMDALVDDSGNIMSYKKWKQELQKVSDPTGQAYVKGGATGNIGRDIKNARVKSALGQIWEQNKTTSFSWEGGVSSLPLGETSKEDKEEDLIAIYNGLKGGYKKQFSKIKADQIYDSSLLAAGFGNLRHQSLQFKGVDLHVDKNLQLKNASGKKQENINKLIGLMKNESGDITTENITLFGNDRVNAGLNAIQKDELEEQRASNAKVAKDFFKGDMSNVTVEFFRNTNVPGQAAYSFYNTKTKKSMVMYAPTKMLGRDGISEDMFVHTARSPHEFTFNAKGYKDMPIISVKNKPAYKSARLTFDQNKNSYIGNMWYWDNDGNVQKYEHEIPMGQAITLDGATSNFNQFLMKYSKSL
jgi:hypothetical protein